jgi:hypothetical protein
MAVTATPSRCVVPARGFLVRADGRWLPDHGLILIAGLYEPPTYTMETTEPNELIAPIHDRMSLPIKGDQSQEQATQEVRRTANEVLPHIVRICGLRGERSVGPLVRSQLGDSDGVVKGRTPWQFAAYRSGSTVAHPRSVSRAVGGWVALPIVIDCIVAQ